MKSISASGFVPCSVCLLMDVLAALMFLHNASGKWLREAKQDGRHGCETVLTSAHCHVSSTPHHIVSLVNKTSAVHNPDQRFGFWHFSHNNNILKTDTENVSMHEC